MTPTQLTALRAAGVWPDKMSHDGTRFYWQWSDTSALGCPVRAHIPDAAAEALLIDAMLDALLAYIEPGRLAMWHTTAPAKGVTVDLYHDGTGYEIHHRTAGADKFDALYSALVAAGIVSETK